MTESDVNGRQDETSREHGTAGISLEQAIRNGWLLQDARGTTLEVTGDFLTGLYDSFVSPEEAMYQIGSAWGRVFGARIVREAARYRGKLNRVQVQDLLLLIQDELVRGKWGRIVVDVEHYAPKGLVLATVMAGPLTVLPDQVADGFVVLLSGYLAAAVGQLMELPMAGVGRRFEDDEVSFAEIAVGHAERIDHIRTLLSQGTDWGDALSTGMD